MTPPLFRVLAVCTGNICRSPAVERLLQHGLRPDAGIVVGSAGTRAAAGMGIAAPMARLLVERGVDPAGFASRRLTPDLVRTADLVLALTREHRSAVVAMVPGALRRTVTLREYVRLHATLDHMPAAEQAPALVAAELLPRVVARRGHVYADPADDDVLDPYGRDAAAYATSMAQLEPAVAALLAVWTPRGE